MTFHILTDSCCDLPKNLTDHYQNFSIIHLSYMIDGEPAKKDLSSVEFYEKLRNGSFSKTSQVNPEEFTEAYEQILKSGMDQILYIGFSGALSGTYASGETASKTIPLKENQKIMTIDSLSASMGMGLLIHRAIQLRDAGKSIEEVHNWIETNRLKMNHWFTVDDLNYLQRGGRISAGSAWFGSVLNIKPVMNVDDYGKLIPREKKVGRLKAIKRLFEKMEELVTSPEDQEIFISHGDCMEDVQILIDMIRTKYQVKDIVVNHVGPVIGSHTGPGVIALFFSGNNR